MSSKLDQAVIAALLSISAAAFAETNTPDPSIFGSGYHGKGYQSTDSGSDRNERGRHSGHRKSGGGQQVESQTADHSDGQSDVLHRGDHGDTHHQGGYQDAE